jgi:hypothetical protein
MYAIINITCRGNISSSHRVIGFVSFSAANFLNIRTIRAYVTLR